ncbi:MAG: hypothetical protein A2Z21_00035 [Candidatus Fraserbacteria bacterium RBG_16_55_9]|uniref:HTH cro/C1-type domain-containing protein n=1 Tax=Fraserbacteria sp. (strain RBG_16_55_9) TaxID=1817864 RepID=A0A1F5UZ53_FRAXR|nr:MAG: hypothetical protein A2Z21_00035 [Candidatus Fraserbacteria bacterium RBG_16_55_9]
MPTVVYVKGGEKMLTRVLLTDQGIIVHFADDREGLIPFGTLKLETSPESVTLPNPYTLQIHLANGHTEEIPWDFARHFADDRYHERSEKIATRGRLRLGQRLRQLREEGQLTQEALAERSGVGRVTIARIESGQQSPRYETLVSLAKGLQLSVERLLLD